MTQCPNYRCRRAVPDPDIIELQGWTSVVCPHCHCVLALHARPRGLDGWGRLPARMLDDALQALPAASG